MRKVVGKVTGTGATLNVSIGFKPDVVIIRNVATLNENKFHGNDDTNAYGTIVTAATGVITAAGSAAAGIVQYDGAAGSAAEGFTIGASALVNVNTNKLVYEAYQGDY